MRAAVADLFAGRIWQLFRPRLSRLDWDTRRCQDALVRGPGDPADAGRFRLSGASAYPPLRAQIAARQDTARILRLAIGARPIAEQRGLRCK